MLFTDDIDAAAQVLARGGVVAFPTDTFYALGADALNADAAQAVFDLKGRPPESPVPVLIPDVSFVTKFSRALPKAAQDLAFQFWPGALTMVMPALDEVPSIIRADRPTVGLRVPDHSQARKLLHRFGSGIVGTSANMTGEPPMKSADEVAEVFKDDDVSVLVGDCGEHEMPSTVVDVIYTKPRILRHGAITRDEIEGAIGR